MIQNAIAKLVEGTSLDRAEASAAMDEMMSGEATPSQVSAFLTALRIKGETVEEVAALAGVMRAKSEHVEIDGPLLDTCGTGGDGSHSLNVSTAVAFVAVGAGLTVAKHGNRSMTSRSGSADVLEALGVATSLGPLEAARSLKEAKFAFLFAQRFHPAMKYVGPTRREIGFRTVFNILGPLTNPAGATRQLIGVPDVRLAELMARALAELGVDRAVVVAGHEGLDELALTGPSIAFDVRKDGVHSLTIDPKDAGVSNAPLADIRGGEPAENAVKLREVLAGEKGAYRDIVVLNSAAALLAGGKVSTISEGADLARQVIDSGAALSALNRAVEVSEELAAHG